MKKNVKIFTWIAIAFLLMAWSAFAGVVVNLNTATPEELSNALQGVGQARAEAIVKYRDTHGPFQSFDDLKNVKGIGDKIIENNKSRMRLNDVEAGTRGQNTDKKKMSKH